MKNQISPDLGLVFKSALLMEKGLRMIVVALLSVGLFIVAVKIITGSVSQSY